MKTQFIIALLIGVTLLSCRTKSGEISATTSPLKKALKNQFDSIETKQCRYGSRIWTIASGEAFKLEDITLTLFRAYNDAGAYKSYLTFSAYATSLGRSTHYSNQNGQGIFLFSKLLTGQGGVVLQWDIPVINIECTHNRLPIFFQKDNVDPNLYPLVESSEFGQSVDCKAMKCL